MRRLSHLSRDEVRAYILADNRLAENAGWDRDLLAIEMQGLIDLDFDIELLGFTTTEIDFTIMGEKTQAAGSDEGLDAIEPVVDGPAVTRAGDLWLLGPHRLLCGDARSHADVALQGSDDTKCATCCMPIARLSTSNATLLARHR